MGITDSLRDAYYAAEDRWYGFVDAAHLSGIVEKIDGVIPSFALVLAVIILLILFGAYVLLSAQPLLTDANFIVKGSNELIIPGIDVSLKIDGKTLTQTTNANGEAVFKALEVGKNIVVDVNSNKGSFHKEYLLEPNFSETIILQPDQVKLGPVARKVVLTDSYGFRVEEEVQLKFYCQNPAVTPNPPTVTDDGDGLVEVIEPLNCGKLYMKVLSDHFQQKEYLIDSTLKEVKLIEYAVPTKELTVRVQYGGRTISGTEFKVLLSGSKNDYSKITTDAVAVLAVVPGNYSLSVSDPNGNYGIVTKNITIVNDGTEIVDVSKTIKARITVGVVDDGTGGTINGASVSLRNAAGQEVARNDDVNGSITFPVTDSGNYLVIAKKVGDIGTGYSAKTLDLNNVNADTSVTMRLDLITTANAGKVRVRVIDQDNAPVSNAKIMLKYASNDSIVELNQSKNYGVSDLNGYVTLLAGKVEGRLSAYAIKYPFNGTSPPKEILIDQLNEFTVKMSLGVTTAIVNVKDETGETVSGEVEFFNPNGNSATGVVSLENGLAQRQVKAGQTVYVVVRAEDEDGEPYENYVSAPVMLWPDKQAVFNVTVYKRVLSPSVQLGGIYNSDGFQVQSVEAGKKYYAKMVIRSDQSYSEAAMHFRAGEENHVENDYLEIEDIDGANIWGIVRGATYDPEQGYAYDSGNLTDGPAKWVNVEWRNGAIGRGTIEVNVWFRVRPETPPNQRLKLFWRMELDDTRLPESTAVQDLYADTYGATYYEGYSDTCENEFCFTSEWLYSRKDELYQNQPYRLKQVLKYDYHFQIINNSTYDYVKGNKPIYLYVEIVGDQSDNKRIRIEEYKIKDALGVVDSNTEVFEIKRVELNSFEKKTSIDAAMTLMGITEGAETIRVRLQSEGVEIFSKDIPMTVLTEKELNVKVEPDFVPALSNTALKVTVNDNKNSPVKDADVRLKIREPGYEDIIFDEVKSDRKGEATVGTGAQYPNTVIVVEVQKEGFAIKELEFVVSDKVVEFDPEEANVQLNTVKKREATQSEKITNLTMNDLKINGIIIDAKFSGLINEGALNAYLEELSNEIIAADDTTKLDLLKIRLANDITSENFSESATIDGKLLVAFETADTHAIYDVELPLTLNITSEASVKGSDCLIIDNPTQSKVTQQGKVSFSFVLTNACNSDEVPIGLENLKASISGDIQGIAELSLQSLGGGTTGRTALDQTQRTTYGKVLPGEKIAGTVTYVPSQDAAGNTVKLAVSIEGTYAGKTLKTSPAATDFTVNVINLKECMSISSEPGPVAFDASTTVTVDASACQNQQIDVILCMGDSGCSGGAEGTITLSKKSFTLKEGSETITAGSPSIPGAYGVSVYARARKSGAYIYIGEVPVFFNPPESKYFTLNKYELNLYGKGSKDAAILTNKMVLENVNVKADECAWGKEDTGFDWTNGLIGMGVGGGLGYGLASAFQIGTLSYGGLYAGGLTVVGGLIGLLVGGNTGYDCSEHYQVNPMNDFVIFLQGGKVNIHGEQKDIPSDAGALGFTLPKVSAGWNFEDAEYSAEELVGINFSNFGLNDPKPKYGLLTVNATEHMHGDQLHTKRFAATSSTAISSSAASNTTSTSGTSGSSSNSTANGASTSAAPPKQTRALFSLFGSGTTEEDTSDFDVFCQNENFGRYWIGEGDDQGACEGAADTDYSQQFRMRVLSGEPVDQGAYLKKSTSCYNGAVAGSTGADAVPRIKLNWSWGDIKKDSCDYDNKDYIYCDASQFSIEAVKRLAILNEFFKQNPSFECPPDPFMEQMQEQMDTVNGQQASVSSGTIGVKEISVVVNPATDRTTINVQVENKTGMPALATVTAVVRGQNTSSPETKNQTFGTGITNVEFVANTPKYNGAYFVSAAVTGTGANNQSVTRIFVNKEADTGCWIEPSTKMVGGKPAVFYYIDTNNVGNVAWTKNIPNLEALHNALLFKAYLIKDGYGQEFRKDFKDYYLETFLQTPPLDSEKALVENFDSDKFTFRKKYLNNSDVEAGLYEVRFNIDSNGDFTILKSDGKLNGTIEVELLLIKKPAVNYPFYSMPFDGVLGKTEGRNGYGSAYDNENGAISLGGGATTFESATGNGIVEIKTKVPNDLASINSFAGTRGQLMSANAGGGTGEIIFSPNYATPIIGKFSLNAGTSGIFGFTVNENGTPKITGGNMTYWTGAAKSRTFYGANAVQVYNDSPDNQLDETSGVSQPNATYGFKWEDATNSGTIYLKTIMYTPAGKVCSMLGEPGTSFWTPNQEFSEQVDLSGIDGMQYNSRLSGGTIGNLQQVFDLVKKEKVCVTNNGNSASFWWNPKTIATAVGSAGNSLETKEESLSSGN